MYMCIIHVSNGCTDNYDQDQNEIKRSSCKIGNNQAIKMSICAVQIKVKTGAVV